MNRVRVLVVAPSLKTLGGQSIQAASLTRALGLSPELDVGFLPVDPSLPGPLAALQRVKYLRTVLTSIAYLWSLLTTVWRYDVVHAFSASYSSYLLAPLPALLSARLTGRKALLNYHSGEAADHLARWPVSRWTMRWVPHEVIVPSRYLVDAFAAVGIASKAIVNFVPVENLPFRDRAPLRPRVLSNRNLEPLYNVGGVLRAFARVQEVRADAELVVAGEGSQRAELEALAASLRLRNVDFLGRVPAEQIGALYDRCDIFANASRIDNMPLSIIEAFACGLPVVTSDSGGIPLVVSDENTGLVVAGGTPDGIAAAILRLLDDPALAARLARNARAECEQHYVWDRVQAEWERCYTELVRRPVP